MKKKCVQLTVLLLVVVQVMFAQSPDTRICNCFASSVSPDFMNRAKVLYGNVGIMLSRDLEIKPKQGEQVKFVLPIPPLQANAACATTYMLYIADAQGNKVFEQSSSANEIIYTFADCNRSYTVTLMISSKSAKGGDGNCSRRITIKVTPQCAPTTASCNCFTDKGTKPGISADFGLNGNVQAIGYASGQRRYAIRFDIINKTACILTLQSLTVHGQTVDMPPYNTGPQAQTRAVSLGFATAYSQPPPAGTKVSVLVRYSLNGRKCAATIELPYINQ